MLQLDDFLPPDSLLSTTIWTCLPGLIPNINLNLAIKRTVRFSAGSPGANVIRTFRLFCFQRGNIIRSFVKAKTKKYFRCETRPFQSLLLTWFSSFWEIGPPFNNCIFWALVLLHHVPHRRVFTERRRGRAVFRRRRHRGDQRLCWNKFKRNRFWACINAMIRCRQQSAPWSYIFGLLFFLFNWSDGDTVCRRCRRVQNGVSILRWFRVCIRSLLKKFLIFVVGNTVKLDHCWWLSRSRSNSARM